MSKAEELVSKTLVLMGDLRKATNAVTTNLLELTKLNPQDLEDLVVENSYASAAREVIAAWNAVAKARKWKRCMNCADDFNKVVTSLKRKEFADYWEANLLTLKTLGLPSCTTYKGNWYINGKASNGKPNIRWFCSPKTHRIITDGGYWPELAKKIDEDE